MAEERPNCFGQLWSINERECTGGYDATYASPTGTGVRPRCACFDECGRVTRNKNMAQPTAQHSGVSLPVYGQHYAQRVSPPAQPVGVRPMPGTIAVTPGQQPVVPTMQQPGQPQYYGIQAPAVAPQVEMMPRNWFAVPQVLAQHEPREEMPWQSLGVEILRGMGMITGLVTADFCSNIPLLRVKKP